MPPPPWADKGAAGLAALPTSAPAAATAGATATLSPPAALYPSRNTRRWIAVLVFLIGVAVAYFGIRAIADTVAPIGGGSRLSLAGPAGTCDWQRPPAAT